MSRRTWFIVSACVGGVLGVLLVRALFLDPIEEIGWRMFWEGIFHGEIMDLGSVVQSTTFLKCLAGFVLGGGAGVLLTIAINRKSNGPPQPNSKSTSAGM